MSKGAKQGLIIAGVLVAAVGLTVLYYLVLFEGLIACTLSC
jgi:hypothetical protein